MAEFYHVRTPRGWVRDPRWTIASVEPSGALVLSDKGTGPYRAFAIGEWLEFEWGPAPGPRTRGTR